MSIVRSSMLTLGERVGKKKWQRGSGRKEAEIHMDPCFMQDFEY